MHLVILIYLFFIVVYTKNKKFSYWNQNIVTITIQFCFLGDNITISCVHNFYIVIFE
jgi:hypothetical protein